MNGNPKRKRGNSLIFLGVMFLFLSAYLFNLIGQGLGPYANIMGAWSMAIGILLIAIGFITFGLYLRTRT